MNKKEYQKKMIETYSVYLNNYKAANDKTAYISNLITIKQDLRNRINKIKNGLEPKVKKISDTLDLYIQSYPNKVEALDKVHSLIKSYYRQALWGNKHPDAKNQIFGILNSINITNKAFKNEVNALFEGLIILSERSLKEQVLHTFTTDAENGNLSNPKSTITRQQIFRKAKELTSNGMKVPLMFDSISNWLLNDLKFTKDEIKERYNFSLEDAYSFNRLVNKHTSFHN